ncbi:MAG TPA: ABC transporter substrate-binding protein [Dehalococcoidia bacterium]|nr:ABC transporter substrate-binding protein [Dehalococcoidia bacterium]
MRSYWDKVLERRISRRRAITATGTTAAAAAFLAACGGDDDDGPSTGGGGAAPGATSGTGGGGGGGAPAGLIYEPVDRTGDAIKGGTWKAALSTDPQNFDLYNFDPFSQGFANDVGTKLINIKPSKLSDPTELEIMPDGAESWEYSADRLTLTFKLNPNSKFSPFGAFHAGAPASIENRQIDADDVLFSWERFKTVSSNGGELANDVSPAAPVLSIEAPDSTTIVMKLAKPHSPLLGTLANGSVSYFYILPKEGADDDSILNKYQFGNGPFYIDSYEPSVGLNMKKNPNYEAIDPWGLGRPFVDEVDFKIIPDPTSAVSQFRAGNLYQPGLGLATLEDVVQTKKDLPDLLMYAVPDSTAVLEWFGMAPAGPWKDQRVRQAVQYSWDRDLFIDVHFATDVLDANGIPQNRRWNTAIPCGGPGSYMYFPGMWLDPQGSEFGENAKYIDLGSRDANLAEAKKLLGAAGFPDGIDFTHYQYPLGFGQQRAQDVIEGMMAEAGLRTTKQEQIMIPEIFGIIFGRGNFDFMFNSVDFGGPDVGNYLLAHFHPGGNLFGGWNPSDTGVPDSTGGPGDPFLNETTEKVLASFDNQERIKLVQEFQRYMAKLFYYSRYPGGATVLSLSWPRIQNWNVYRGGGLSAFFSYEYLDPSQPPA